MHEVPVYQSPAKTVEDCFWKAYQQCNAATMLYVQNSVDVSTTHTFSFQEQQGKCVITDDVTHRIVPQQAKHVGTFTCAGLEQQSSGLKFSACGDEGDQQVPNTV